MPVQSPLNGRSPTIEIDVGLAYEFLLTLIVFVESKGLEFEVGQEWFETAQQKATPELLAALGEFRPECRPWHSLLGLVYEAAPPRDVPALLTQLEILDPFELRLHLLGYYQRSYRRTTPLDVILLAAQGNTEAQRQYLKVIPSEDSDWQEVVRLLFATDAEVMKDKLLHILQEWYTCVFRDTEQQVFPILERDAEAKRMLKQTLSPERLIETATNGLEYVPEPGLRKVLLVPSFIMRPWNETPDYQDMKLFFYPVADETINEDKKLPSARLVRLYKALADERRLCILKLLMTRSYSLQELADEFGVPKTTMHHHLGTLRSAGLVRARSNDKVYSLRHATLSEVSELLSAYFNGKS